MITEKFNRKSQKLVENNSKERLRGGVFDMFTPIDTGRSVVRGVSKVRKVRPSRRRVKVRPSLSGGGVLDDFMGVAFTSRGAVPVKVGVKDIPVEERARGDVQIGVDLKLRSEDVKKIFYAGFGKWCLKSGYVPEEVLQEVYAGILARNRGRCPWDRKKGTFGGYVHRVCGCVLMNYHKKRSRRKVELNTVSLVKVGSDGQEYGGLEQEKAPETGSVSTPMSDLKSYIKNSESPSKELALAVLPHMLLNHTRKEMGEVLGLSAQRLTEGVSELRKLTREWQEGVV